MTNAAIIRSYTNEDEAEALKLFNLNVPNFFSRDEETGFIHYLNHEIEDYFVVTTGLEQKIVGCGGINFEKDNETATISWDIIHPDYQGKGFGASLLSYRILRIKSLENIKVIKVRTSQETFGFYEKNGFQLIKIVKDYWAKGFDLYEMQCAVVRS